MKKFFNEFKEFISKGNVMDMAIGVIIATAFGKITTSLVNDVFMPLIGMLIGGIDLGTLNITLSPAVVDEAGAVVKEAVVVGIGTFLTTVIDSFWSRSSCSWSSRRSTRPRPSWKSQPSRNPSPKIRSPRRKSCCSPRSVTS